MREIIMKFDHPEVILDFEVEELALKILSLIKTRTDRHQFHPGNMRLEAEEELGRIANFQRSKIKEIDSALGEAYCWLEFQGLIIPASGMNGSNGWKHLTRRSNKINSQEDYSKLQFAYMLPKEILHHRIKEMVWSEFIRNQYDAAVLLAMKAVEVYVREAGGFKNSNYGVDLMRDAFNPMRGPLTDNKMEKSEREARSALFAGAIGAYKNPSSHRDVEFDNPADAIEAVLLANHLLKNCGQSLSPQKR